MRIVGTGTDIVDCLRIARLIERHGELFIERVYTAHEISYCSARHAATQHFAGRWAAKEAVLKALSASLRGGIRWQDIEIRNQRVGGPTVSVHGIARDLMSRAGIRHLHVSISHCRTHAVAFVIAEGD